MTQDLPRRVSYAESADPPQTRRLLLEAYAKGGARHLQSDSAEARRRRCPTTSIITSVHRATAPFAAVGRRIASNPALAHGALDWTTILGGGLAALIKWALLRTCGLHGSRAVAW